MAFVAQHPVDLTLSVTSWVLRGDFEVMDFNGVPVFRVVKSRRFSMNFRRSIKNAAGQTIVSLKRKIMTMRGRWEAFRGESTDDEDMIFTARKSSVLQDKTPMDVFLAGNTAEQVPDFRVIGSWSENSCTVFLGDTNTIVAQMYTQHNSKGVRIYPNVNYALVIALIVILDDREAPGGIGDGGD